MEVGGSKSSRARAQSRYIVATFCGADDLLLWGHLKTTEGSFPPLSPDASPYTNPRASAARDPIGTMPLSCLVHEGYCCGSVGVNESSCKGHRIARFGLRLLDAVSYRVCKVPKSSQKCEVVRSGYQAESRRRTSLVTFRSAHPYANTPMTSLHLPLVTLP